MSNETNPVTAIIESDVPLDWITLEQFGNIIGYPARRLYKAKEKWPEGQVWQKIDSKIYFSLEGWNQWLTDQATINCPQASDLREQVSKSTSKSTANATNLRSRSRKRKAVSQQLLKLEVN